VLLRLALQSVKLPLLDFVGLKVADNLT